MNTGQPPEDVRVLDQVIDDLENTGWMQGDQIPDAQHWVDALAARGYVLRKAPVDGDTMFGIPQWDDPEQLLNSFAMWLHCHRQLTPAPPASTDTVADQLEDLVLHFIATERETALLPDDEPA
jgi:hypothetical protein